MRRATVGQWASRNSRDELAHNEVRIIFSTYFISNLSYYISNIYFEYFELILGLYLVVYIYPIYTCYIFDLFYFEFIVLYIEYIFRIFRTYFRAVFGRIYISNLYVLYFRLILFRIYRTIYRIYILDISNLFYRKLAQKRGVTK